jgi:cytochrome c553
LRALFAAALLLAAAQPGLAQTVAERAQACFACHGASGHSAAPLTPSLGGQPSFFVVAQLFLFREGRRPDADPAMSAVAKGFSDGDLRAFGDYIASLPPPAPSAAAPDPERYRRGAAIAREHHCPVCHSRDYSGQQQVPRLAAQREDYLAKALRDYKSGKRIGYGGAMANELKPLSDGELDELAHFLAHFRKP